MQSFNKSNLSEYNEDVFLTKIWQGDTVFHDVALFTPNRKKIRLLYPVDEIISLRSYSLDKEFALGKDFKVTADGEIELLEGSEIPVYTSPLYTEKKPESLAFPLRDNPNRYLCFTGDTTYPSYAVAVSYKHTRVFANGFKPLAPQSQKDKLKNVIKKLEQGKEVNVLIFGDSISCGWSSSGLNSTDKIYSINNKENEFLSYVINVPPFAPTWFEMVISKLSKEYPLAKINLKNLALGGAGCNWGKNNFKARIDLWKAEKGQDVKADLVLVGFGVNDVCGNLSVKDFKANIEAIVDVARNNCADDNTEFLIYSPMIPTQKAINWDKEILLDYEAAIEQIADNDDKIAVTKLTSLFNQIIKSKEPQDYLNTNCNHGNDFTARMYATSILATFGI